METRKLYWRYPNKSQWRARYFIEASTVLRE